METVFWIGPYADFNLGLNQFPEIPLNNNSDESSLKYRCELYDKTVILYYFLITYCRYLCK